jgi:ABC-type transport system involved in resistance to organic solvents, auxiliary component
MKSFNKLVVLILILFTSVGALAADPEPLALMKRLSNQMLSELNRNLDKLRGKEGDKLVNSLVDRVLLPHFDLVNMSRAVVGRDYWQKASLATQQQFTDEFTKYVSGTYAAAIRSYDGEEMKFYPIRGEVGDRTKVDSDLLLKNGSSIRIQYSLAKQGERWLIYDFSVDGISLVKNYNSQFAAALRQGGLSGLLKQLQQRNISKR